MPQVTVPRALARRALLTRTAALGPLAATGCTLPSPTSTGTAPRKQPQGRVEFWSNSGYPYKDRIVSKLVTRKLTMRDSLNESVRLVQEKLAEAQRACAA